MRILSTKLHDEIEERIESARRDVEGDGHDWDAVAFDVIQGVAADYPEDVRREILRTELGLGIFPDDPDPIEEWVQPEISETREARDKRLAGARERVEAIRREYGANRGDHR